MLEEKIKAGLIVDQTSKGTDYGPEVAKPIAEAIYKYGLNLFMGPEWLFLGKEKFFTEGERDEIVGKVALETADSGALVILGSVMWHDEVHVYNSAPIILEGNITYYHKRVDGGGSWRVKRMNKVNGSNLKMSFGQKPLVFYWKNLKCGHEICADHSFKKLKKDLKKHNEQNSLDIYFLNSCGMNIWTGCTPIKENGLVIQSDGYWNYSGIWSKKKRLKWFTKWETPEPSTSINGFFPGNEHSKLNIYEVNYARE